MTTGGSAISLKDKLKALLLTKVDIHAITWDDLATAIGPNADKYEKLWQRMQSGTKNPFATFSPCWSAVPFFGVPWAMARNMPLYALVLCIGMVLADFLLPGHEAALGLALAMSFSQKSVYIRWLLAHIQQINDQGLVGEERQQALRAVGGLNAKRGWITAGALVGLVVITGILYGALFGA